MQVVDKGDLSKYEFAKEQRDENHLLENDNVNDCKNRETVIDEWVVIDVDSSERQGDETRAPELRDTTDPITTLQAKNPPSRRAHESVQ